LGIRPGPARFPGCSAPAPNGGLAELFEQRSEIMKVTVDPQRCRGHARCIALAPEAFHFLDLEDRAEVDQDAVDHVDIALLTEAEQECPERAITVEPEGANS
jgi:ferredoxin